MIEITKPEVGELKRDGMNAGACESGETVMLPATGPSTAEKRTGAALIAAMRASPHQEIEIEPARRAMPVRDVSL